MNNNKPGFHSKLVHGGNHEDHLGSPVTPIYQTSTFKFKSAEHGAKCFTGESDGYIYTRLGNPTIRDLEKTVAQLENGYDGIAASSGMGAINTVYMTYLEEGSHILSTDAVYGPSRGVIETVYSKFNIESTYIDTTQIDNITNAIRPNTRLLYLETPANPTMAITDMKAASEIAHSAGITVVVDNTFCSPYLQRPLDLGVDIVVHSMTKFINGHEDVVAGMIIPGREDDYRKLKPVMINMGFNMDPHQAYLVRRGLKTLAIRIDKSQQNAMQIADFLENHQAVKWVKYPGLKSHPQFELASKQMDGPGSMISFGLKGGYRAGIKMMNSVKFATLAVSLGGIETLIQHPASMTHSTLSKATREATGVTDELVRLSVGIEDVNDIIADLDQAMM